MRLQRGRVRGRDLFGMTGRNLKPVSIQERLNGGSGPYGFRYLRASERYVGRKSNSEDVKKMSTRGGSRCQEDVSLGLIDRTLQLKSAEHAVENIRLRIAGVIEVEPRGRTLIICERLRSPDDKWDLILYRRRKGFW